MVDRKSLKSSLSGEPPTEAPTPSQRSRAKHGMVPFMTHTPKVVKDQLKILAVEQGTTIQALTVEGLNLVLEKYGKTPVR